VAASGQILMSVHTRVALDLKAFFHGRREGLRLLLRRPMCSSSLLTGSVIAALCADGPGCGAVGVDVLTERGRYITK
jgi:hypothetical protein